MIDAVASPATDARASTDQRGYYSVSEAAALLGVSRVTIWRWVRAGRLPAVRLGYRTTRIARDDLERALTRVGSRAPRLRLLQVARGGGTPNGLDLDDGQALVDPGRCEDAHAAQFYETDPFLLDVVQDFIGAALRAGDTAVVVATAAHRDALEERLRARGLDLAAASAGGQFVSLDASETLSRLMVDGSPEPERFARVIGSVIARAAAGQRRVRVFGEMVALLAAAGNYAGAVALERLWSQLQQTHPFSLLCAYPIDAFSRDELAAPFGAVCAEHARVIPAESYVGLDEPDDRLRAVALLQQRARSLEAEIAERGRVEQELRRSQQELHDFVENATVGLHRVGPDGRILWANQAELDLLGYTREEYIGRHIAEFHVDQPAIDDILRRLAAREELHDYETRLRCKNGAIKHVLISSNALWEGDRFVHTRCFTRDITDRVRAEQGRALLAHAGDVLAASLDWESTLHHVIGLAMPALADFGFFDVVEADGQVRRIARAHQDPRRQAILEASRWAPADHTELNVCALTTGRAGLHPDVTDAWLRAVATGPEHLAVMRELAFRSMVTVPLRHGERMLGALTLFYADSGRRYDETDLVVIEELARRAAMAVENARLFREAQAAIRARDQFLSIPSHELRNPVAGITGAAQMLRRAEERGQLDADRLHRYVGIVEQAARRLGTLTEDLLDVARLRRGDLPFRPRPTDVATLLDAVTSRLQANTPTHRFVSELACRPCPAVVDPDRVEQVIENLLANAVKYSPDGGDVRVTLTADADGLLLRVADSGIGVPRDALERIFEPFGRAPNAADRNIPGLGLGLYICRQIAEQHGGRLWAESAGEGRGTTLLLRLPTADCPSLSPATSES